MAKKYFCINGIDDTAAIQALVDGHGVFDERGRPFGSYGTIAVVHKTIQVPKNCTDESKYNG